eukprot:gene31928-biopygen8634
MALVTVLVASGPTSMKLSGVHVSFGPANLLDVVEVESVEEDKSSGQEAGGEATDLLIFKTKRKPSPPSDDHHSVHDEFELSASKKPRLNADGDD